MNSSQINFYLMPEDVAEISKQIEKMKFAVTFWKNTNSTIEILTSWTENKNGILFFLPSEQKNLIQTQYIDTQNYYVVDPFASPVIEFSQPFFVFNGEKLKAGRFYYIKDSLQNNIFIEKPKEFLDSAAELFKWFKKHFPNQKIPQGNGFWVTPRTAEWVQKNNGILLPN